MFENIISLFKTDTTTFFELYKKIVNWKQSNVYPYTTNLPEKISFPVDFWEDIKDLHIQTLKDGHERAISIFWVDGELLVTSVVRGSESNVHSNNSINVKYVPHPTKKDYFRKEVYVNDKVTKRKDIYFKNAPKQISLEYIFNMHTHPKGESDIYSFFSLLDIQSFLLSNAVMIGLVTDKLWILVRSSDTPKEIHIEEKDITVDSLKNIMHMGVYSGEFFKKVVRM